MAEEAKPAAGKPVSVLTQLGWKDVLGPSAGETAGKFASRVAKEFKLAELVYSLKVNGAVLKPGDAVPADGRVFEIIEHVEA